MCKPFVSLEINLPAQFSKRFRRIHSPFVPVREIIVSRLGLMEMMYNDLLHQRIDISVTHENRSIFVGAFRRDIVFDLVMQEQITRQAEYSSQFIGASDTCE